jgi:hypothetical protein
VSNVVNPGARGVGCHNCLVAKLSPLVPHPSFGLVYRKKSRGLRRLQQG